MHDHPPSSPPADFFTVAAELGLLPAGEVATLREESAASGLSTAQFVLERGLLSGVDVDIVETLSSSSDVVPGYKVVGLIGKGGMGVVYRAEQRTLRRVVALKTILVSRMADKGMLERFELEAHTVGQLRHPNIIAAHDFGRHGGRLYLAMELVEGTDLDHEIKSRGALEERYVWGLAHQTAAGLAHAVQHRIVHRDVKPANLMLVEPPEGYPLPPGLPMVKVADFGLALLQGDLDQRTRLTATDATLGSPHYMAPEQLESSDVDFRADMYALGATIFHALTGQPPFAGMKLSQLIAAKLGESPPSLEERRPGLSPATGALVARLMARRPEERPPTYTDLLREIDAVVQALPATPPPPFDPDATVIGESPGTSTSPLHAVQTLAGFNARATAFSPTTSRTSRRRIGLVVVGLALLAAALLWWSPGDDSGASPLRRPAATTSGPALSLLNGFDTHGWVIGHGNWVYRSDEAALSGTDGLISHSIPAVASSATATDRPQPLRWYRLELIFQPLRASNAPPASGVDDAPPAQELLFGLPDVADARESRLSVLRRTADGFALGTCSAPGAEWLPRDIPLRAVDPERAAAVSLERLPTGWFVEINGEFFGAAPLHSRELPEFSLRAEGTARFAEMAVYPLRPQSSE